MPVCPECRRTWPEGVVLCRDCRVPLRDVPDPVIAALWQGALESQGLHPVVHSRALPGYGQILQGWNSPAWGELLVPEDELEEASVVLADFIAAAANSPL